MTNRPPGVDFRPHPFYIDFSSNKHMTTTTVTACPIASTVADVERYIDALDRALDCPFIQEDDCCADLELLRGLLIGAEMMATR